MACLAAASLSSAVVAMPVAAATKSTTRSTAKPTTTIATGSTDRIAPDYSKLAPAVVARRAIGAMVGDHSIQAKLTIADDAEPHVIIGHVDPSTGDARITYEHIVEDDPTSATPNEVRILDNVGYGAVVGDLREELMVDWYRYALADQTLSPPDILIGSLVATSPVGASKVTAWKSTLVTTFGPNTRHFVGTASAKEALPLLSVSSAATKVKFEMWVDRSGELRRLSWTMPATPSATLSTLQMSADFRDRHKALVVSAPLKNVVDLADLITPTGTV